MAKRRTRHVEDDSGFATLEWTPSLSAPARERVPFSVNMKPTRVHWFFAQNWPASAEVWEGRGDLRVEWDPSLVRRSRAIFRFAQVIKVCDAEPPVAADSSQAPHG